MQNETQNNLPLLQLKDLSIGIHEKGQTYTAVDSISYNVYPGEILGVVGESGCGKTVTNLATGHFEHFPINGYKKYCLMNGLDDIDFLVENQSKTEAWEQRNK